MANLIKFYRGVSYSKWSTNHADLVANGVYFDTTTHSLWMGGEVFGDTISSVKSVTDVTTVDDKTYLTSTLKDNGEGADPRYQVIEGTSLEASIGDLDIHYTDGKEAIVSGNITAQGVKFTKIEKGSDTIAVDADNVQDAIASLAKSVKEAVESAGVTSAKSNDSFLVVNGEETETGSKTFKGAITLDLTTATLNGDNVYTATTAAAKNATLTGAIAAGATLTADQVTAINTALSTTYAEGDTLSEADSIAYNATLTGAVKEGDLVADGLTTAANTKTYIDTAIKDTVTKAVVYKGVLNEGDKLPTNPTNGDMYKFGYSGSETIEGKTYTWNEGDIVIYSSDKGQWEIISSGDDKFTGIKVGTIEVIKEDVGGSATFATADDSVNYVSVAGDAAAMSVKIGVKTTELGNAVGMKQATADDLTTVDGKSYVTSTLTDNGEGADPRYTVNDNSVQANVGDYISATGTITAGGLATAGNVAAEIVEDEKVVAAALNDHESRLDSLESGSITIAEVSKTGASAGNEVSVTVKTENGSVSSVTTSVSASSLVTALTDESLGNKALQTKTNVEDYLTWQEEA